MALGILKTSHFSSPKHLSHPFHLISILLSSNNSNPFLTPNPKIQLHTSPHSPTNFTYSPTQIVANELCAAFSKHPSLRNNTELDHLAPKLTPETVETVLKGIKSWQNAYEFFSWAAQQFGFRHNCYTYNTMASVLSRASEKPHLKTLVKDVVNFKCPMTPGALGFLIRCLGSEGLVDEACYLFENARVLSCVPNAYTYNCLLEALAKSGEVELVELRFKEMVDLGWKPDKYTLTPVLQAYCNAGKFKEALDIFYRIHSSGWIDEHVFTVLVVSFSKWGEVDKAFELIERMENLNIRLKERTFHVLIHGFSREMRVDKAVLLFDKMKGLGFTGDLPLYSVLIKGLCDRKESQSALDLYSEMKDSGILPDVNVIRNLISSLCGVGDLIPAMKALQEDGECLDADTWIVLYNTVLEGLVNLGEVDKVHSLVRETMKPQNVDTMQEMVAGCSGNDIEASVDDLLKFKKGFLPNATSFRIVIDGLCKTHKLDVALELLHEMIKWGCTGNLLLYNNLIHELCNADRLEESYKLWNEMKEYGFEPTHFTYNSILGCLCRRENVPGALDLVREMREHGHEPWIKNYTMLVKKLCVHGKTEEACSFLNDLVQVGVPPNLVAYSTAIYGLFRIGEVDQALKLFRHLSANQYLPDVVALNILIHGLCKAGRVYDAHDFLNEMLEKRLVPSVVTYNLMIDGWCKTDRIDLALLYFSKMTDVGRPPTVITYTTLIDGLCNARRPDDAIMLWNDMKEKSCAPNRITYTALVNGLLKCGQEDGALVYFHEMEAHELDADTFLYVALIDSFVRKNDPRVAFKFLEKMVQKTKFPSPTDKNYTLLKDAIHKLCEDQSTSMDVQRLIKDDIVPVNVHDLGVDVNKS